MKALLTKNTLIIASVAVLIAIITIVSINVFNSTGPVTGLANTVTRPVRALASTVTRTFERIYASIYRYDNLMAEYERVLVENAEIRNTYRESTALAEENQQLRVQLGFRERSPGYEWESATFQTWSGSNWSHSFTINRGHSNSSIARGQAVVTEYGVLIGQVTDVGATTSTVATVLDTTFSAGAYIGFDRDSKATVRGDFSLMRSGLIMLDHIDDDIIILPGDSVETSGIGGTFPPGLIVGEVLEVQRHSTGVGRYATVRPSRVIDSLTMVFIITGFEATESLNAP